MTATKRGVPKVALVIGSGSVKCAAALGLWKVLQRHGIRLDMVVGSSGGSVYATGIAFGDDIATIEDRTRTLWVDLMSGYSSSLRAAIAGETHFNERSGLVDADAVQERLSSVCGERTFAEAAIALHLVATDFMSGEPVVLSQGSVVDALQASMAIPIIFPPHEMGGRLLTDGAVSSPLPVDVAIKGGMDIILTMGFELSYLKHMPSLYAVQSHLNAVYTNHILRATHAFYNVAHHAEIIPILPTFEPEIDSYDTAQLPHVIEMGEKEAEAQMPYLRRLLSR